MKRLLILAGLLASAATAQVSTLSNPPGGTATVTSLTQLPTINNNTILGNNTGSPATPSALTVAQAKSVLSITNTDVTGLGSASTANTGASGHVLPFLDGANTFSGGVQTISGAGGPLVLDATDSNGLKIKLRDNGTTVGWLGANSTDPFVAANAGGSNIFTIDTSSGATFFGTVTVPAYALWNGNTTAPGTLSGSGVVFHTTTGGLFAYGQGTSFDVSLGNSTGATALRIPTGTTNVQVVGTVTGSNLSGTNTGDQTITLTGDVTGSGTGSFATALSSATVVSKVSAQALAPASVAATGSILSSGATSGVGYTTGAGGSVTQLTSRTTGVTLNKACGAITLFSAAGSATWATFVVTDSAVAATDVIVTSVKSATNLYILSVTGVGSGTFNLSFATTGGTATDAPVINYCVIKAVAA